MGLRVLSASRNLIYLIIIPILSFLILRDGRQILTAFLEMLDSGQRRRAKDTLADVHELLLLYMRALLFLCCATLDFIQHRAERYGSALCDAAGLDRIRARVHTAGGAAHGGGHHHRCQHGQRLSRTCCGW